MKRRASGRAHRRQTPGPAGRGRPGREPARKITHGSGTILILGGYGRAGMALARGLLQETPAKVIIAGRSLDKALAAAGQLRGAYPGKSVLGLAADASDPASLREALRDVRLLVVASSTTAHTLTVARAALECGCDYLDIQYGRRKLETLRSLEGEILRLGRCFITEAGFHPGLPAAIVRYAASSLERIDSARLSSLVSFRARGPMPSSMVELVESFRDYDPRIYRGGRWGQDKDLGRMGTRPIDFGHPFGVKRCTPMVFEELRTLPEAIPTLRELRFDIAGFSPVVDWTVMPLIIASLALFRERALAPMAHLLWTSLKLFPPRTPGTILGVEARGELGGLPVTLTFSVSHDDEYVLTALPVVAGIRQYIAGLIGKPGLWMLGHIVDPYAFVSDIGRMGLDLSLKLR